MNSSSWPSASSSWSADVTSEVRPNEPTLLPSWTETLSRVSSSAVESATETLGRLVAKQMGSTNPVPSTGA